MAARRHMAMVLAAASTLACAHASIKPQPESRRPKLVLLPLTNLGAAAAPLKDLRRDLSRALAARGIATLDEAQADAFLARHRIRHTGGIDRETAAAAAQELGADAFLVTSIDLYQESAPLELMLTMRLVAANDAADIL